ncbi:nuclear receptor coactivator 7-like [Protopterus annectens]|uniref:nuclear receptor coactivator 7-like n=1 Tax=Protopterus annectens TaxID=7888 RepID=UPI001CFBA412|nr:nuclear receptor coactivator 7-like [Protopterus annectens]
MEKKEEKKERQQGYFSRLKRKKAKQNSEGTATDADKDLSLKGKNSDQNDSKKEEEKSVETDNTKASSSLQSSVVHKENASNKEEEKKKTAGKKDHKRPGQKRFRTGQGMNLQHTSQSSDHLAGDATCIKNENRSINFSGAVPQRVQSRNKDHEKKEKKMVHRKPPGTIEYTVQPQDSLNSIALKFNITSNKLAEINKLFSHTIVPGQTLYVPDTDYNLITHPANMASPLSSDADYDKLSNFVCLKGLWNTRALLVVKAQYLMTHALTYNYFSHIAHKCRCLQFILD